MTPFRALLVPFHFTSGVFITTLSVLLSVAIHYDTSGFLWLLPAFICTSWLFKYAFAMLESIADGEVHAPVASIDMLSPFEQRPFLLLLIVLGIGQLALWTQRPVTYVFSGLLLTLVPAFIGLLGTTRRVMLSLNPLAILQTVRGMGAWYLLILLAIAASVAMMLWLVHADAWLIVLCWQIGMSVLLVFSLIGGVMYERRIELGYEPRISPERMAIHDQRQHDRELKHALDEMYNAIRLGDLVRAMNQLEQWLSSVADKSVSMNCQKIHSTVRGWNDIDILIAASRALAVKLCSTQHPHMLEELLAATVQMQPEFTFKSETALLPVVHELQIIGRYDLGRQLVVNFVNTYPSQTTKGITALRWRLEQVDRQ